MMLAAEAKLLELTTEPGWWLRAEQGRVVRGTGVVTANAGTGNAGREAIGGDGADEAMGASASQALDEWTGTNMRQQQQGVHRAFTEQQQQRVREVDSERQANSQESKRESERLARGEGGQHSAGAPDAGAPTSGR